MICALALAAAAEPLDGEPPAASSPGLTVQTSGECPSQAAVMRALLPALGHDAAAPVQAPGPEGEPPRVTDLGDRFEISAFGQTRQYADAGRDCAERARVAAVFITLALNPPVTPFRPRPPPPPPPPTETTTRRPAPPEPPPGPRAAPVRAGETGRWLTVGVSARVDGPMDGASATAGVAAGAELQAATEWRLFGVAASVGMLAPTESTLQSVEVRQQRFPLSLAVTARRELPRGITAVGAVGLALVPFTLRGDGLGSAQPATRIDAGARIALDLLLPGLVRRAAPFLGVHAEYFPRRYTLDVGHLGDIGTTSRFWLGASLGVAFEAL